MPGEIRKRTEAGLPTAFYSKAPTNWTPLYVVVGTAGVVFVFTVAMVAILALVCVTVFGGIAVLGLVNIMMGNKANGNRK
jgi:hypothetical protein